MYLTLVVIIFQKFIGETLENYHFIGTALVFIGIYLAKKKNDLLTENPDLDYLEILNRKKFGFGKSNEIIYIYGKN